MLGPPALKWLDSYCGSTGFALDAPMSYRAEPTVNPLVFNVHVTFGEDVTGKRRMLVWNLLESWAAKNEASIVSQENDSPSRRPRERELVAAVAIKRLTGIPKDMHPLGMSAGGGKK